MLNLSYNQIKEISTEITNLVNLRMLSLQSNNKVGVVIPTEITNILKARNCNIHL